MRTKTSKEGDVVQINYQYRWQKWNLLEVIYDL